ncbi:MAG: phosphonate C-P lyase system protein PhnG [Betaproteobacteria bacterium]|nr:MAG: phosphonate C-P lyase system protein PhnG [Betaproteobacteria bacterium]
MFQTVDKTAPGERQRWIKLLARAPQPMLEAGLATVPGQPRTWLRRPETGLLMVQGRVGGTGNRFNVGEITVTRCALRLSGGTCGVAYVQGRSHSRAEMVALADALLQVDQFRPILEASLLARITAFLDSESAAMTRKAQSTRVDFFTVARESGGSDAEAADS